MLHNISTRDTTAYWNDLFTEEEIDQIYTYCQTLPIQDAHIGPERTEQSVTNDIRKSKVAWVYRNHDTEWIFSRYDGAVQRINSALFCVDIDPLQQLQFTIYEDDGDHYDWHWDMQLTPEPADANIVRQRKISVVTQLNDPSEYEGGVLKVGPCGRIYDIDKEKGSTFMFLSFVNHIVTPVTSGTRYSLVGWYEGPDWR